MVEVGNVARLLGGVSIAFSSVFVATIVIGSSTMLCACTGVTPVVAIAHVDMTSAGALRLPHCMTASETAHARRFLLSTKAPWLAGGRESGGLLAGGCGQSHSIRLSVAFGNPWYYLRQGKYIQIKTTLNWLFSRLKQL